MNYIETAIDRYLEPVEYPAVAKDWQHNDVYHGDDVYLIDGEIVPADQVHEYIESQHGRSKPYDPSH